MECAPGLLEHKRYMSRCYEAWLYTFLQGRPTPSCIVLLQHTQNICIIFVQCWTTSDTWAVVVQMVYKCFVFAGSSTHYIRIY